MFRTVRSYVKSHGHFSILNTEEKKFTRLSQLVVKSMQLVMGVGYTAVSILAFDLGQPKTVTAMYGKGYFL